MLEMNISLADPISYCISQYCSLETSSYYIFILFYQFCMLRQSRKHVCRLKNVVRMLYQFSCMHRYSVLYVLMNQLNLILQFPRIRKCKPNRQGRIESTKSDLFEALYTKLKEAYIVNLTAAFLSLLFKASLCPNSIPYWPFKSKTKITMAG